MAQFLSDTFTDTDGVLLSAHTPDGGGTWTKNSAYTPGAEIFANTVGTIGGTTNHYHSGTPASADYSVTATMALIGVVANGVTGRGETAARTFYHTEITSNNVVLRKAVAGAFTTLGTYTGTVANNDLIKLDMVGTTIRALQNGTERLSASDSAITATGKAGLWLKSSGVSLVTTITADDAGGTTVSIAGVIAGVSDVAGAARATYAASGAIAGGSTVAGSAGLLLPAAGVIAGVSALTGSAIATYAATGTVAGVSDITGAASANYSAAGVIAGVSALSGSAGLLLPAAGTIAGASDLSAAGSLVKMIAGIIAGVSDVAGSAAVTRGVSGEIAGVSGLSANLTGILAAAGAIAGGSTLAGAVSLNIALSGLIAAVSSITASGTVSGTTGWTPETPPSTIWTPAGAPSTTWTAEVPPSTTWT